MCGITGMWGGVDEQIVQRMMDLLAHRGPDAEGLFVSPHGAGALGHRRLSIMDPLGGDQPIYNEDYTRAVIANGEIYNFPRLMPVLSHRHLFRTTNDTEAILHLYEDDALDVVDKLDGMYAFAVADGRHLFLARDPIGIKPLYYGEQDGKYLFASELKALAGVCRDIQEFPPGSLYHSGHGGLQTFYTVPQVAPKEASVQTYLKEIRRTLEHTVTKRLMSDVPLGAFLSGGLDSSLIAALARRHMDELHTFSVGLEGSRDLEAARIVAQHLDTIHHEYILTPAEILSTLPQIIYYLESYDQDLVRSGIPCYFTARLASENVKVILTGEGADELFAGYTYYKEIGHRGSLHSELRRSVASLHNINLQRVDRMTMAHAIEGRVPFLDLQMIRLGQLIPAEMKLAGSPPVEKWILRKAFEDLLPPEIIWRQKEQFDEGSGTADLMNAELSKIMTPGEAQGYRARFPDAKLRSAEECHYHRLFMEVFENPEPILANVARWADRPAWAV
jgi:asparagine synthase (glutamine-hydrolysing)